jgi:hypothetical protein
MLANKSIQRPRPMILGLAGAVLAVLIVWAVWPAASQSPASSNPPRVQQRTPAAQTATTGRAAGPVDGTQPGQLAVRLGDLKEPPPEPDEAGRNPFRFYVKPPPPPPPPPKYVPPPPPPPPDPNAPPPPPPPPPPIPLKFIGTLEQGKTRVAIFSDGRGLPQYAAEGATVLGQYRVVKIGVESVVMEYLDGRGRQTIPMRGGQ